MSSLKLLYEQRDNQSPRGWDDGRVYDCWAKNCDGYRYKFDFSQSNDLMTGGGQTPDGDILVFIDWNEKNSDPFYTMTFTLAEWKANPDRYIMKFPCQFDETKAVLVRMVDSEGASTEWRFEIKLSNT